MLFVIGTALSGQDRFTSLDSTVQAALDKAGVPGAALVVVRGDRVVHIRGFGKADDTGRPVTPDT
ncbi:MAG TPA: serine hydrolase, partial [Dongiaceae bacterium]|nr:serine hydrolase [Dongiaceae bacterium]